MNDLKISLIQAGIFWEDKARNIQHYGNLLKKLSGESDLAVLPEMFSTGFSMQAPHLAETNEGATIQAIRDWAKDYDFAVCGSFLAKDDDSGPVFNRGFFIEPNGNEWFYDKRHLFRMGLEHDHFAAGNRIVTIPYKGWNIRLIICYDLRFPVWIRNRKNEYDILVCSANWPAVRVNVWQTLLCARALENQCYVCGVNRIGKDGGSVEHQGDSVIIDFKGNSILETVPNEETVVTGILSKAQLNHFRERFPAWMDADEFEITMA
jgi:predicted amidohydrolase